jgi:hypothetical protein
VKCSYGTLCATCMACPSLRFRCCKGLVLASARRALPLGHVNTCCCFVGFGWGCVSLLRLFQACAGFCICLIFGQWWCTTEDSVVCTTDGSGCGVLNFWQGSHLASWHDIQCICWNRSWSDTLEGSVCCCLVVAWSLMDRSAPIHTLSWHA